MAAVTMNIPTHSLTNTPPFHSTGEVQTSALREQPRGRSIVGLLEQIRAHSRPEGPLPVFSVVSATDISPFNPSVEFSLVRGRLESGA